jgi:hypothetical protein
VCWKKPGSRQLTFPEKQKKAEIIRKISYLVGDPLEVDEKSLKSKGVVRVRVYCKDATKIVGSALVHINGQSHMLKWRSEKLEDPKGNSSQY